jgi:two-component system sensor histidine kinase UhpB
MRFDWKQFLRRGPEGILPDKVLIQEMPLPEIALTLAYVAVASLWYVFSEVVLERWAAEPSDSPTNQAIKAVNFILVTSLVLYFVLRRTFRIRRQAQEALRLSYERFQAVALAATDAVWDWNLDTNVLWWSDGIQKLFGYGPDEISNQVEWWLDRLHPEDRERVTAVIRRVTDAGGRTWTGHYRFRRSNGAYAMVLDRGYIIQDAAGKPTRVVGGMTDITERQHAQEALEKSRLQLRALSSRLQAAREEERTTVAREIHDELGQVLTAIKINLDWLERKIGEREDDTFLNPVLDRLVESAEMAQSAIHSVQRIATDLRPDLLDNLGLTAALEQEAHRFEQRTGTPCQLQLPAAAPDIAPDTATALFRVFQEALTNIARHARATAVRAALRAEEGHFVLEVEDNGQGMPRDALTSPKSLGLVGMRERATALGGVLAITPATPRGTHIVLRLPRTAAPAGTPPVP